MRRDVFGLSWVLSLAVFVSVVPAWAQQTFEGEKKQACEAVMCLSSGERPEECQPSLKKYFSIKAKKPWKTLTMRKEFLKKCPSGGYEGKEEHLDALVQGAEVCEMPNLLAQINTNEPPYTQAIPEHCFTLANHQYTTEYGLPIRAESCYADHLEDLGPAPTPIYDWNAISFDGYSEPPILNTEEVEAYKKKERLQVNHPTPICVSRWHDPVEAPPLDELDALLIGEVERVDGDIVVVMEQASHNY